MALCIGIKWLLIGRVRPGPSTHTVWRSLKDWVVDLMGRICTKHFFEHLGQTILSTAALRMMGVEIALDTFCTLSASIFYPSRADLL